ncbi:ABC transporter ATP-binding protein [Roseibium polysiphoniae]|uniref:ABC transporter ATP-binding protein n=1 Tax=Roseibium polysiphoniae TaxID=2571221 RepID=A0ABR9C9R8_9HYPH|nr:ABC transporter ATP-binding protein [Roseibium polysiphoniae]MBD8876663.1 ABC transporter ATP-binding protein [Roseibium polysiphoniae]
MIRLDRVTKSFKLKGETRYIAKDVSFTIPRGDSIGLLGRNGAGKSTLLRLIAGTIKPTSGRIIRRANVSFPLGFQGSFNGSLTGEQNVRFVARIYGHDTQELVDYVQDFAELGKSYQMPVKTYSSGMKARLAFGVSMGINFDYYLVDEITAVGDANFKKKCQQVFRRKLQQSDIIMVSHSNGALKEYCTTGVVLEDGSLTYFPNIDDAISQHNDNMARR